MDDRKHDESMLDWARRLHEQVADLRGKLDHERQLREETVAMQAREIQRLRHELRAEGISERIVMGPGITVEGYGHTYRYVRDKPAQAESEKAAGSDLQADPVRRQRFARPAQARGSQRRREVESPPARRRVSCTPPKRCDAPWPKFAARRSNIPIGSGELRAMIEIVLHRVFEDNGQHRYRFVARLGDRVLVTSRTPLLESTSSARSRPCRSGRGDVPDGAATAAAEGVAQGRGAARGAAAASGIGR